MFMGFAFLRAFLYNECTQRTVRQVYCLLYTSAPLPAGAWDMKRVAGGMLVQLSLIHI